MEKLIPGGVPTLAGGYLPWPGDTYLGRGTYLGCMYLPWPVGYLPWPGGYLPWPGGVPTLGSTCYAAGAMPLAFTQEDFLVVVFGGSSELPMWLTGCFWVTFFGRWWGLCAYT